MEEQSLDELNVIDVRPSTAPSSSKSITLQSQSVSFCCIRAASQWELFLDVPLDDLVNIPSKYLPENDTVKTYVLCRLGNDPQAAAEALRGFRPKTGSNKMSFTDVIRGWGHGQGMWILAFPNTDSETKITNMIAFTFSAS